jgi:hypothetical protein
MVNYILYLDKFNGLTHLSVAAAKESYCTSVMKHFTAKNKTSKKRSNMVNYFQSKIGDFI